MSGDAWGKYLAVGIAPRRRVLIGGNWKCNGTTKVVGEIVDRLNKSQFPLSSEVVIAVPTLHLLTVKNAIREDISVSAQDVGLHGNGAYTGETSAALLADVGVQWTLAGHSERRVGFGYPGEPSAVVAKKTAIAVSAGLNVILCIGEHLADREAGKTMEVCSEQLSPVKVELAEADWAKVVIAYEPVWAIGTGKVATPEQAEETHRDIREWLRINVSADVATNIRIIYGGSVKASNCQALITCPNIDGFLVGGASLLPEFVDIMNARKRPREEEGAAAV